MPILGTVASQFSGKSFGSFESIATAYGNDSSVNITFSSIPSTYKHLQIRWSGTNIGENYRQNYYVKFNGSTGTPYTWQRIFTNAGTPLIIDQGQLAGAMEFGYQNGYQWSSTLTGGIIDILEYASTSKSKTVRSFSGFSPATIEGNLSIASGMWISTDAITSITISAGEQWATGSQFALYGIKGS
jgi:hypothetical protein